MTDKKDSNANSNRNADDKKPTPAKSNASKRAADSVKDPASTPDSVPKNATKPVAGNSNTTANTSSSASKAALKTEPSKANIKQPSRHKPSASNPRQKVSKVGLLALLVAVTAGAGVVASMWWLQQQNYALEQRLLAANKSQSDATQAQFQQQLSKLSDQSQQKITAMVGDVEKRSGSRINNLNDKLQDILDRQPANWQLWEAEYLTRMAGRILWLEKNPETAIALIKDADARLKSLRDPGFNDIRELLHQDIESLKVLPKLERDEIILSLMGLSKQVPQLPLAQVQKPEETEFQDSTALSTDVSDWQQNLAKSWRKFKDEFITIRRRAGNVEPLLAPKYEQNLLQNLQLKFQQAQWAVSQSDSKLYRTSISDIQHWLNNHFDMTKPSTQEFNKRLGEVGKLPVNVNYPKHLKSQQALRAMLDEKMPKQKTDNTGQTPKVTAKKPIAKVVDGANSTPQQNNESTLDPASQPQPKKTTQQDLQSDKSPEPFEQEEFQQEPEQQQSSNEGEQL